VFHQKSRAVDFTGKIEEVCNALQVFSIALRATWSKRFSSLTVLPLPLRDNYRN
jgi:hypothetical protein